MKSILLAGAAFLAAPTIASAQDTAARAQADRIAERRVPSADQDFPEDDGEDSQTIVVTGEQRGSVIGDIPPENVLSRADVRTTGATDINELLEVLAPQIGSARGRGGEHPILLLNGQRISSFRELRDIPADAISRVEILPEEVALKYGYRADRRVVNIVLSEHFRSTAMLIRGSAATEGGHASGTADVTRLMIAEGGRTTINLHAEAGSALTENERDILIEQPPVGVDGDEAQAARSLIGSRRDVRATFTHHRQIGSVGATGNLELAHNEGRSLIGLGETVLEPLARDTASDSAHAGLVLNGSAGKWHWSVTGNADASRNVADTDRDATGVRDRAVTGILSGDIDAVANGTLFAVPAGQAGATIRVGGSTLHLDSDRHQNGIESFSSLGRTRGDASVNFDLPISRRTSDFASLGNLTLNGNAEVGQLSDFGTLTTVGAGVNWSPVQRLDLIASWTREEGAPTAQQLGDAIIETPATRIFDFTTGETALVTAVTGGNPDLDADRRKVMKLGVNWKPFEETDIRLRGEYVRSRLSDPISSFPGPTPALEAALPERFARNSAGQLIRTDLRPVNFDSARRDTLRLGFDFSIPLKSAPQQPPARGGPPPEGDSPSASAAAMGPAGPDGQPQRVRMLFGPGFGDGGRVTFSLTDTVTLVDEVTIRDRLKLDYLHGDAVGQIGGRPRHDIEARAGYFSNGRGALLSANRRSGTRVTTATGEDLRFSPLATFDISLFATMDPRIDLVAKNPWLEGASIRLEMRNLFNSKPKVRDALGNVPFGYQADLLDPLGRTVSITFRKGGGGIGG